ncbi:SPOR domain-containing protein [Methylomonas sp. SURF-2]|uniref:SPOR domain-containing protein n=1 Tax=Methylomonas subterranea TaxID=2952225 RepID=A0ABT1THU0_9GAMM|nr:SPOR domain-containing protein [Methylomonas sp. SURF-2]MCQ8105029.1 SPOR domain-containing protein [Methylomonas sp. SURF-2]
MAQSKNDKNQKPQDSFADDLDSMLNLDGAAEHEAGLIDDDAIDRLLIGDAFEPVEEAEESRFDDIDGLIAIEPSPDEKLATEFDEFGDDIDDLIADIQINPKQNKTIQAEPLPPLDVLAADNVDQAVLELAGDLETFPEQVVDPPEITADMPAGGDVLADMAEIDEFSEDTVQAGHDRADFLLADFDISVEDEFAEDEKSVPEAARPIQSGLASSAELEQRPEIDDTLAGDESSIELEEADSPVSETESVESVQNETAGVGDQRRAERESNAAEVEYAALIAGLGNQINDLVKQQAHLRSELQLKHSKDELTPLADAVDKLQTEQKKAKRTIDALNNKKPVSAYVANAIAVIALVMGGGLGYQGYVAKSQLGQVVEYLHKIQSQINTDPAAEAAEKEMLRNQLDELSRANSVISEQIAELTKSQAGAGKPSGDLGKQLTELSNQDMQMGAAIELLQSKVAALEKNKVSSAPVAKPAPKTPPVARENWVVNLVAFKQDWYAKRKAEEFAGKGVPATVVKSDSKGETWYRLSVDGFKSQYEAAAYAARVKKTLNLDSVWVSKAKN